MSWGDNVEKKQKVEPDNKRARIARDFDLDSPDRRRAYRNGYPREGYVPGETNPFSEPKEERKAPPLRGV